MNLWICGLYAGASFLALKSLTELMTDHKRQYMALVVEREQQRAREEQARQTAAASAAAVAAAAAADEQRSVA